MNTIIQAKCMDEIYEQYIKPHATKNTTEATIAGLLLSYGAQAIKDTPGYKKKYLKDIEILHNIDDFVATIKYICKED